MSMLSATKRTPALLDYVNDLHAQINDLKSQLQAYRNQIRAFHAPVRLSRRKWFAFGVLAGAAAVAVLHLLRVV